MRAPLARSVFHVHAANDEPEMAGVAGEPAIANAAHALPSLDRGSGSAPNVAADARHAADASATFGRLPERLVAVGLVGEIALLVVPDQRFGQNGGHGHCPRSLGLPHKPADFIDRPMRFVAEIGFLALHRHPHIRIARVDPAAAIGRTLDRSFDQSRPPACRA
jgi:hypothetical protein